MGLCVCTTHARTRGIAAIRATSLRASRWPAPPSPPLPASQQATVLHAASSPAQARREAARARPAPLPAASAAPSAPCQREEKGSGRGRDEGRGGKVGEEQEEHIFARGQVKPHAAS
eukprot:3750019-Pleurochrysis_carterae.AAC.2